MFSLRSPSALFFPSGVVGADLALGLLSSTLRARFPSPDDYTFVIEAATGYLVATSLPVPVSHGKEGAGVEAVFV